MGELVVLVINAVLKLVFIVGAVLALIAIFNIGFGFFDTNINNSVLTDIFALIQMWLPFNLDVIFIFLGSAVTSWFGYKLSLVVISVINKTIGYNG